MIEHLIKLNNKYLFCLLCVIAFFTTKINGVIDNSYVYSENLISIFSSTPKLYIDQNGNFSLSENKINNATELEYGPDKEIRLFICLTKRNSKIPEFDKGIWFELDGSKYENYCVKNIENYALFGHVYSSNPNIKGTLTEEPDKKSFDAPPRRMKTDISYDEKYSKLYYNGNDYLNVYSSIPSLASNLDEYGYDRQQPTEDKLMYLSVSGRRSSSTEWYRIWDKKGKINSTLTMESESMRFKTKSESMRFKLGDDPFVISECWIPKNLWNLCTIVRMYGVRVDNEMLVKQAESIISSYNLTVDNPWGNIDKNKQQVEFEKALNSLTGK